MEGGPGNARALDCGAGIGRITKHLLTKVTQSNESPFDLVHLQHFQRVDLLEQDKHFLEKAVEYLDGNNRVGSLFCSGLQNFDFVPETYDVIWCQVSSLCLYLDLKTISHPQWVLGHLTDEHLEAFFVRCIKVISLIAKEKITLMYDIPLGSEAWWLLGCKGECDFQW